MCKKIIFFLIRDLERENIKNNIDSVLITLVTEILRLNNYVIGFFKGSGKVPLVTELETTLFESFQTIRDFSFRDISHFDKPEKIYYPFRDSSLINMEIPRSVSTTTTITIIKSKIKIDSAVYINLLSNEYEMKIRENFIGENQTMNSSHKHFPTSLLIDKEIKISANSNLVSLLPENLDSVSNNILINESQIKIKKKNQFAYVLEGLKEKQKYKLT